MADQLPIDLIGEILHRIPAESLIRFKATSKKWNGLISSDKNFMYKHLEKSPQRFLRIDNHERVQIMDPVTGNISATPIPDEFRNTISYMVHCDGLMLCLCEGRGDNAKLAVWNPVLREIKWIEPSVCYGYSDYFGIGYSKNTPRGNYKLLRFWGPQTSHNDGDPKFEIYEFESDSWKVLDAELDRDVDIDCKGVSVKGNMYWIANNNNQDFILSFDFSSETFNNICVCPPSSRGLAKYFEVTSPDLPTLTFHGYMARPGFIVGKHRNIMVWCEADEKEDDHQHYVCIRFYEIDEVGITNQIVTGRHGYGQYDYNDPYVCSNVYVPSLISIPVQKK